MGIEVCSEDERFAENSGPSKGNSCQSLQQSLQQCAFKELVSHHVRVTMRFVALCVCPPGCGCKELSP